MEGYVPITSMGKLVEWIINKQVKKHPSAHLLGYLDREE